MSINRTSVEHSFGYELEIHDMIRQMITTLALSLLLLGHPVAIEECFAADILLYDQSLNSLPESQPWLFYAQNLNSTGTVNKTLNSGGTQIATNSDAQAGWSNTIPLINVWKNAGFPQLDPSSGFALDWTMQVTAENHDSTDRAGFNVILLGNDKRGIELGFWTNEIWAQNASPMFTHGESSVFDTQSSLINYRLEIINQNYQLKAGATTILSGLTRDYSAFGSAPYTLSNYLFMGDDTTSAGATVQLGSIQITTPVPESESMIFLTSLITICLIAKSQLNKRRLISITE